MIEMQSEVFKEVAFKRIVTVAKYDFDIDLISGRYAIDAKSIMGIFSLDLSKPIDLNIHAEDNLDAVLEILKPYMV